MALNKANITWTAKQISKSYEKGNLTFDNVIQRGYVWETTRKAELIHSMIEGYPIPPFYARRVDGKVYDFLDGKQRMNAIYEYLHDGYVLQGIDEVTDEEGNLVDLNGLVFSALPEYFKDTINSYSLLVYYFDGITDDEVRKLFKKLNNGKPLSTKARNIANCVDIMTVSEIASHEYFQVTMTDKAKADRKNLPMVVKMNEMLTKDVSEISFKSADFNEVMAETSISAEGRAKIGQILNMALEVYNLFEDNEKMAKRKFTAENNFISLVPFMAKAIDELDEGIRSKMFYDFIKANFSGRASVSDAYASAARSASASTSSIMARNEELQEAWDKFFTVDVIDEAKKATEQAEEVQPTEEAVEATEEAVETVEEVKADENTNEAEEAVESVLDASEYRYGMRNRGFSIGCQPKDGFVRQEDDADGKYHDIIVYNRELTEEELIEYELDQIA